MKPTRQALRRIAREAAKPTLADLPSLTRRPQRRTQRNVRAGLTTNKGHSKRRGPTTYARRRQSYRNRYIIAPVTVEFTQVESTQAKETES